MDNDKDKETTMKSTNVLNAITILTFASAAQAQTLQSWMSPEVQEAWNLGFKGQKVTVQVIDDFTSATRYQANLGTGTLLQRHGEWTRLEASMIAPLATMKSLDFNSATKVSLARSLNVLNLSYGMYGPSGLTNIAWDAQESSIIGYANGGSAVVSKAAGNDGVAVGTANSAGNVDYLAKALTSSPSTLIVGALSTNGTTAAPATLASNSNIAGSNPAVQAKFIVVGVEGSKTGLYGTSMAAPIVSGYAAIIGSKFTTATPTQITNQLLNTARTDTISNYSASVHGRGEASIARAIAPVSIK
jgi:subtilisin family serine protease